MNYHEPWHCGLADAEGDLPERVLIGDSTCLFASIPKLPNDKHKEYALRIVACVNACRGIPNENLSTKATQ